MRTEANLVFSIFNSNPDMADNLPLFDLSRTNLLTGGASALSATSLASAVVVLRKSRDISGVGIWVLSPAGCWFRLNWKSPPYKY